MKLGMKILCAAVILAGLFAVFCEDSCSLVSAKSAEAGEMSMISKAVSYVRSSEGYTVSVISAEDEPIRIPPFVQRAFLVLGVIIVLVIIFSGAWIPILGFLILGGRMVGILVVVWNIVAWLI